MGCASKCGSDAKLVELLIAKHIQEMIEDGRLQAGLKSCHGDMLRRDRMVLTCDSVSEAICKLVEQGDVCFDKPIALSYDKTKGKLQLIMSGGETLDTPISAEDTFIESIRLNAGEKKIIFTYNNDRPAVELDLSNVLKVNVTEDDDGITITDANGVPHTLPKVKVKAAKRPDGTVVITNQDGSMVEIDPVRQGDAGAAGARGESAYDIWKRNGGVGDEAAFLRSLKGADGAAGAAGSNAPAQPRDLKLVNSSGKVTVGYAYTTEQ